MDADFCVEALEEALARYGKPEIFNTDQGSQFMSQALTSVLQREEVAISMDGRGVWRDNAVVERLWRSVKYEEVYLRAYGGVSEARGSIGRYLAFDNGRRPHSSLRAKAPDQAYFDNLPISAIQDSNRQTIHLSVADPCADQPGHLSSLGHGSTSLSG